MQLQCSVSCGPFSFSSQHFSDINTLARNERISNLFLLQYNLTRRDRYRNGWGVWTYSKSAINYTRRFYLENDILRLLHWEAKPFLIFFQYWPSCKQNWKVRWPTIVTSKPNAHSKLQIAHIKFTLLAANSNGSQQIQIAHSELQSPTANYKSLTANSNRPQQIQIVHSKLKSLTANSNGSQQITNY